jgi:hypothetical protein
MSDLLLPGMAPSFAIGDPLDRCYTPDKLAQAIVDSLAITSPQTVLEPSVGGGAFVRAVRRAWPDATILGVDIDPDAPGLALCDEVFIGDFLDHTLPTPDLIVGNPPFKDALAHVAHAEFHDAMALVLPLAYLGVKSWAPVLDKREPASVRPILGRPWPKRVRETAVYWWTAWSYPPTELYPPLAW